MRPTAFVCGPLIADSTPEIISNIKTAEQCAIWLWENNFYVFCPHKNTAHFNILTTQPESVYKDFCFKILRSGLIDLLILCGSWTKSNGSTDEMSFCITLHIPVFEWRTNKLIRIK